jgi:hypothetical protein
VKVSCLFVSGKLSQVLGSPKDVVDERAKSGIYEIQCQTIKDTVTIQDTIQDTHAYSLCAFGLSTVNG